LLLHILRVTEFLTSVTVRDPRCCYIWL